MQMRQRFQLVAMVGLLALLSGTVSAAVPGTALIEGTLHSSGGGAAADGDYATVFAIYKDQTGGSPIWFEGPVTVKVAAGQFSYALGTATALKAADLTTGAWLGMKIGQDPELARKPLHSVAYALRAAVAEGLSCTGCVGASQLDATALKDYLKAGDLATVALSGSFADLSGAPDLTSFVKAANLADVATTGAYADLTGTPDLAAYAKTAGLAKVATTGKYADLAEIPAMAQLGKSCGSGLVVIGIKADGTLECAQASAAATIAADNIDEISNGLIWNQFTDVFASAAALPIPDNNPIGGFSEIVVGDVGLAQKLTVSLELTNSDLSTVQVWLYDSANQEYVLYNKGGKKGDGIKTAYPDPTTTISGDLTYWAGKNPKGTWRLKVVDTAFLNNTTDGQVVKWSVNLQTLSSKKIQIKGDLVIDGNIISPALDAKLAASKTWPTLRWGRFATHDYNWNWFYGNTSTWTLGVAPSTWTDGNGKIWSISTDKNLWRTVLANKMNIYPTLCVLSDLWYDGSSTNGKVLVVLFRVKNTTGSAVNWAPAFYHTNYGGWSECSSATINGASTWENCGTCYAGNCQSQPTFSVPANRTSSIMFAIMSTPNSSQRAQLLTFYGDTLKLPVGLEYVDDLDTAAGDWSQ
jgi:subtilisin-like proprotein convertase family protein